MTNLIVTGLTKTYPDGTRALRNIDMTIPRGMFGLLGPNGAGKSTLMRIIATLQEPDRGEIRLGDLDVLADKNRVRRILGYLPQEFGLYPHVNAEDLLNHFAVLKGVADRRVRARTVQELLELTNLARYRKQSLAKFSGGMKQRFGIAQALLGDPELLIVDEPTAGLDPEERERFHNLLSEIGRDRIVLLSTHIVSDVSDLCANMAILHQGRVVLAGTPEQTLRHVTGKIWRKTVDGDERNALRANGALLSSRLVAGQPSVRIFSETHPGEGFEPAEPELQDVYFAVIKDYLGVEPLGVAPSPGMEP